MFIVSTVKTADLKKYFAIMFFWSASSVYDSHYQNCMALFPVRGVLGLVFQCKAFVTALVVTSDSALPVICAQHE
jgi:hypothetical protein